MKVLSKETRLRREIKALKHEIKILKDELEYESRLKNQAFSFIIQSKSSTKFTEYCAKKENQIVKPPLVAY